MNIEYKNESGEFPIFYERIKGEAIAVLCDANTEVYADGIITKIQGRAKSVKKIFYADKELIPDENAVNRAEKESRGADRVLAVGSGTLNDMGKAVSFALGIPCGVFATAASMDGYCSKGAALIRGGFKVTSDTHSPEDILIDLDVIKSAPKIMTAAGFGDVIGKYTCLTDWKLSNVMNGEEINGEAFALMETALSDCVSAFDELKKYSEIGVSRLIAALITAGTAMAICGNSRPASGSEHHQSHFLEMDFARRGEHIPLHGLKVAVGTLVSLEIYNHIADCGLNFPHKNEVKRLIEGLPRIKTIKNMLVEMGCPTRFSAFGVRRETMEEMIEKAYTVRDRYTVLTFVHDFGLTEEIKPIIMEKYF